MAISLFWRWVDKNYRINRLRTGRKHTDFQKKNYDGFMSMDKNYTVKSSFKKARKIERLKENCCKYVKEQQISFQNYVAVE